MLPNVPQYPVAVAAILRAGLVVVNVNPLYSPRELEHPLKDSVAKAIIVAENFAATPQQVVDALPPMQVVLAAMGDMLGLLKGAVLLHRNLVANILQSEAGYQPALKKIPAGEQIMTVCALPLFHIFGFNTHMMLGMRMGGCPIIEFRSELPKTPVGKVLRRELRHTPK